VHLLVFKIMNYYLLCLNNKCTVIWLWGKSHQSMSPECTYYSHMNMEAVGSPETVVNSYQTVWYHIPGDNKPQIFYCFTFFKMGVWNTRIFFYLAFSETYLVFYINNKYGWVQISCTSFSAHNQLMIYNPYMVADCAEAQITLMCNLFPCMMWLYE
jgi:hypothetical protein